MSEVLNEDMTSQTEKQEELIKVKDKWNGVEVME